jgi:hypothetical protein
VFTCVPAPHGPEYRAALSVDGVHLCVCCVFLCALTLKNKATQNSKQGKKALSVLPFLPFLPLFFVLLWKKERNQRATKHTTPQHVRDLIDDD